MFAQQVIVELWTVSETLFGGFRAPFLKPSPEGKEMLSPL